MIKIYFVVLMRWLRSPLKDERLVWKRADFVLRDESHPLISREGREV